MSDLLPDQSAGPWQRTVTTRTFSSYHNSWASAQRTETLDMNAAAARLREAMTERPDASLRDWLDVALNGWPASDETGETT